MQTLFGYVDVDDSPVLGEVIDFSERSSDTLLNDDYMRFCNLYGKWWEYRDLSRFHRSYPLSKRYIKETLAKCVEVADSTEDLIERARELLPRLLLEGSEYFVSNAGYVQEGIDDMENYLFERKETYKRVSS